MVAFTFDDGPGDYTAAFLDELKERGVHVTFFVKGTQVEQHPELVTRMAAEGHLVGNHSYSHPDLTNMSVDAMKQEIDKCSNLIEQYTGKKTTVFRAPGGAHNDVVDAYLAEQNLRLCGWQGGGRDWDEPDKDVIVNFYMKNGECTIQDGDIVLLHEVNEPATKAALELIDMLLEDGVQLVTVQELLDARANGGQPGTHYSRVVDLG